MVLMAQSVHERIRASARVQSQDGLVTVTFHAMATTCRVSVPTTRDAQAFLAEAMQWVADFEARYSRFIPESLISRINQSAGKNWVEVDEETDRIFALCQELFAFTRGCFDPTALPLIALWNWKEKKVPADADIQRAKQFVGWRKVQRRKGGIFLPEGMCVDLGGVGKEYAVDRVAQLALQRGFSAVLVDFGQDICGRGVPPGKPAWHIGLEDAKNPGKCWTGVAVQDRAVACSGDYFRYFIHNGRRYGHIVDPRTGYPVDNGCRSVAVIAPVCTLAGALTTTAFILGPQEGLRLIESYPNAEGCITTEQGRVTTRRFYEYVVS